MTLADYINKEADPMAAIENVANRVVDTGQFALLAAPVLAGMTAGGLHSVLTSPGGKFDSTQKALVAAEMEEALAEMERRKQLAMLRDKMKKVGGKSERSLHI
jgi:hypothetical protein